ncbi:hypothetical protein T265_10844 [Opisthorchis viverrini]|uniref:Uncharacterized protein n=1 Tax=Opisthorchis viverrini TaxID=6198 RepID=A0A074Z142_OPIVI|nr:hypothetical protein T265_10844 [Opisthorchis viverrini]KER20653.1 hypothetical protein T265_10844 [Opisthorchis viverrini]
MPFQCLAAMPPKGSTRHEILPGCPMQRSGSNYGPFGHHLAPSVVEAISIGLRSPFMYCQKHCTQTVQLNLKVQHSHQVVVDPQPETPNKSVRRVNTGRQACDEKVTLDNKLSATRDQQDGPMRTVPFEKSVAGKI